MYKGEITEELKEIYRKAEQEGIWLREWIPGSDGKYMAAAGNIEKIEELEKELGQEIDIDKLELGDIIHMSMPGIGSTREEACLHAISELKRYENYVGKKK